MLLRRFFAMLLALISASAVFAGDAVHDAICSHDVSRVKTLVNRANVNRVTGNVYPLELASYCYGGAPAVANYLLDIGADVNLHKDGYSALMWALRAYSGNEAFRPVIIRMIEKGADLKIVDATTGRTPLMGAAGAGDAELVRMMLSKGADRNARTTGDWCISGQTTQCTAADQARLGGFVELALELEGKDATAYRNGLSAAIKSGNAKLVQERIAAGADVNLREELSLLTPLHYAVKGQNHEIVKMLLKAGANPNTQNFAGISPLRDAVTSRSPQLAFVLIDAGARANNEQLQGCGGGLTEYGWSIEYSQVEISRYMIERGAIDPQNPGKVFAETYGRNKTDLDMAKLLIAKGARPSPGDINTLKLLRDNNAFLQKNIEPIIAYLEPYAKDAADATTFTPPILRSAKSPVIKDRNAGRDGRMFKSADRVPGE
ncbi:MAG: ankyrin repeat domain-containing protein [Turneriella sp.]|nr:ankyrin repeat domain-containing protein [Turneriella sp.]